MHANNKVQDVKTVLYSQVIFFHENHSSVWLVNVRSSGKFGCWCCFNSAICPQGPTRISNRFDYNTMVWLLIVVWLIGVNCISLLIMYSTLDDTWLELNSVITVYGYNENTIFLQYSFIQMFDFVSCGPTDSFCVRKLCLNLTYLLSETMKRPHVIHLFPRLNIFRISGWNIGYLAFNLKSK